MVTLTVGDCLSPKEKKLLKDFFIYLMGIPEQTRDVRKIAGIAAAILLMFGGGMVVPALILLLVLLIMWFRPQTKG